MSTLNTLTTSPPPPPFLIVAEGEVGQWINPFFKAQIKLVFFMVYKEMLEMWQVIEISISIWATAHLPLP